MSETIPEVWLVERDERDENGRPVWLHAHHVRWTPNAHEALRFDWQVAANRQARTMSNSGTPCTATAHVFVGMPKPPSECACPDCTRPAPTVHTPAPSPSAAHAGLLADAEAVVSVMRRTYKDAIPVTTRMIERLAAALRAASPSPGAVEADPTPTKMLADLKRMSDDMRANVVTPALERAFREGYEAAWTDQTCDNAWQASAARRTADGGVTP